MVEYVAQAVFDDVQLLVTRRLYASSVWVSICRIEVNHAPRKLSNLLEQVGDAKVVVCSASSTSLLWPLDTQPLGSAIV